MHEYAIVEELVEQAEDYCQAHRATKLKSLTLEVGRNSGYSVESLRLAYELLKEGTIVEGSRLVIKVGDGDSLTLKSLTLEP